MTLSSFRRQLLGCSPHAPLTSRWRLRRQARAQFIFRHTFPRIGGGLIPGWKKHATWSLTTSGDAGLSPTLRPLQPLLRRLNAGPRPSRPTISLFTVIQRMPDNATKFSAVSPQDAHTFLKVL